jgi:hypothetical protein
VARSVRAHTLGENVIMTFTGLFATLGAPFANQRWSRRSVRREPLRIRRPALLDRKRGLALFSCRLRGANRYSRD